MIEDTLPIKTAATIAMKRKYFFILIKTVDCRIQIVLVGSGVSMSARWSVTNPVPPCYSFTSDMVIHGNLLIHGNLVIHGNHSSM